MQRRYFAAGTVNDPSSLYIERQADRELREALLRGELCYVFAPRKLGKSSLKVRTIAALRAQGVRCVALDLSGAGTANTTLAQWYYGLTFEIQRRLRLEPGAAPSDSLSPVLRFSHFLRDDLLRQVPEPLVIFIDEIDSFRSFPNVARDDFFAALRSCFEARAEEPALKRLAFCLLGVVHPEDLIKDPTRTPFNIGRGVTLEDFTADEMAPFAEGLGEIGGDREALLEAVYDWTQGDPFLTQALCLDLSATTLPAGLDEPAFVAARVRERFFTLPLRDDYLNQTVRFLRDGARDQRSAELLSLYRRLLEGETIAAESRDAIQADLRLTGLAAWRGGCLRPRNRIFTSVFDLRWVAERESCRVVSTTLRRWREGGQAPHLLLKGPELESAKTVIKGPDGATREESEFLLLCQAAAHERAEARRRAAMRWLRAAGAAICLLAMALRISYHNEQRATSGLAEGGRVNRELSEANRLQERLRSLAETQKGEALRWVKESNALREKSDRQAKIAEQAKEEEEALRRHAEDSRRRAEDAQVHAMLSAWGAKLERDQRAPALLLEDLDQMRDRYHLRCAGAAPERASLEKVARWLPATPLSLRQGLAAAVGALAAWAHPPLPLPSREPRTRGLIPAQRLGNEYLAAVDLDGWLRATFGPAGEPLSLQLSDCAVHALTLFRVAARPQLALACEDRTLRLFALRGAEARPLPPTVIPGAQATALWASERRLCQGQCVLVGGRDGQVRLLSALTGRTLLLMPAVERGGPVQSVSELSQGSSPDEVDVTYQDGRALRWSLTAERPAAILEGHRSALREVAFAADQRHLITLGADGWARRWDLARWESQGDFLGEEVQGSWATQGTDGERVWRLREGAVEILRAGAVVERMEAGGACAVAVSPRGTVAIAAGAECREVTLWRDQEVYQRWVVEHRITRLRFLARGQILAARYRAGVRAAGLWDGEGHELSDPLARDAVITERDATADGRLLVSATEDGQLCFTEDREPSRCLAPPGDPGVVRVLRRFSLSQDGRRALALVAERQQLRLWRLQRGPLGWGTQPERESVRSRAGYRAAALAPDGQRIAVIDSRGGLSLLAFAAPQEHEDDPLFALSSPQERHEFAEVHFSPDGRRLLVTSADGAALLLPGSLSELAAVTAAFYCRWRQVPPPR